jgi:glycosyltransferase involved in cell wall biosynthesis
MSGTLTMFLPSLAGGGAERCFVVIANALAGRGVRVTLALANRQGPFVADIDPAVHVLDFDVGPIWRALPPLVRHLKASRPTAVLAGLAHANAVAALAHRIAGSSARLVLSEHAHVSSMLAEFPGLRMRSTLSLMKWTYPWADRVVTVSDGVQEDLMRHVSVAADRMVTIHNPVVDDRLQRLAQAAPTHPWLREHGVPVVLAAGRLIGQKDFATLLDAFAKVRRERAARLIILGEGELREALQQRAEKLGLADDVSLPGFEANPFSAMRMASVFVLSSRFEGLANVLIEAMACGAAVVSTDCPSGPREILEDGRWGLLVPVCDSTALAQAIANTLDEQRRPDVRARAAAFADRVAVQRYAEVLGLIASD